MLKSKSRAKQQVVYNYQLQLYSVATRQVSARLGAPKIGEHLAQHIAGLSKFCQKVFRSFSSSCHIIIINFL